MTLVAGLDFGTSGAKLVVLSLDGEVVARAQADYPTVTGPGGQVEQDPDDWWAAARAVLAASGVASSLSAIGLTGQMQDLVPVAGRRALRPAMLYSDTRATDEHAALTALLPDWERRTGNHQDASNVAAKIAWLSAHEPHVLDRAEKLLLGPAGFVAWRAGAPAACDPTTASTTGLLDVQARNWFGEVVRAAGVEVHQLPSLTGTGPSAIESPRPHGVTGASGAIGPGGATAGNAAAGAAGPIGTVDDDAAAELGVPAGTPLVLGMGDAGATTDGLIGAAPGSAYLYLGTTGWIAGVTAADSASAEPSPIHSLVMPGWEHRLRIGAVQSAGAAADWARKTFFPGLDFEEAETQVAPRLGELTARPLCLPGLSGERTPVRDPQLRGAFIGVQESTGPADLYLAVLTGVAMGLRHAADEMGIRQDRLPLVGGAAVSPAWRQILADVFGATIVTGEPEDPAAHSAARAAATALTGPALAGTADAGTGTAGTSHTRAAREANTGCAPGASASGEAEMSADAAERVSARTSHGLAPLLAPGAVVTETAPSAAAGDYAALLQTHRALYDVLAPASHQLAATTRTERG